MGSGGSQTLWSPSNEAGAKSGFIIDTVHVLVCVYVISGWPKNHAILFKLPVASAVIDGGTLRFTSEPFKREQSN